MNKKQNQIEKVMQLEKEVQTKNSTLREFILLTLIHAEERFNMDTKSIVNRVKKLFECRAIVIATEKHQGQEGKHYHVGIWAKDASKNTVRAKLRKIFPEWTGRAIDISLHKGWGSVCSYITKEDKEPLVWGEFTIDQIRIFARAHETKKEANVEIGNIALLKRLERVEEWYQVYRDEILANKVLQSLPRMKEAFEDLKTLKDIETNVFNRIIDYLKNKGNPREYDVEEIREKYLVIDWIACQLCFKRPIKTKQLFIYGEPSTQKTLLLNYLSKVIKIYFASSRRNDFAGANDYYDMWVFDEFHEQQDEIEAGQLRGATAEGSAFVNNLLKVLDGQECRLDSKYSRVFKKKRNVPIIMIANKLPKIMEHHGPFRARFFRIRFETQIKDLEEERVIATLWGCLLRRVKNSPYARERETPGEVTLDYNKSNALMTLVTPQLKEALQKVRNPLEKEGKKSTAVETIFKEGALLITREGEVLGLRPKIANIRKGYNILLFEILKREKELWRENRTKITLLDFANIPIKKKEQQTQKEEKINSRRIFELMEQSIDKKQQERDWETEKKGDERTENTEEDYITRIKLVKQEITRLEGSIFRDDNERKWIEEQSRRHLKKPGHVQHEEVYSIICLQRKSCEKHNDYAMWPLEIKICFGNTEIEIDDPRQRRIFPAVLRIIREGEDEETNKEEEKEIQVGYEFMTELAGGLQMELENPDIGEIPIPGQREALRCEISLTRNGEGNPWNTES